MAKRLLQKWLFSADFGWVRLARISECSTRYLLSSSRAKDAPIRRNSIWEPIMPRQKSAKRASIDMLKQFERDIERFQEKAERVREWSKRAAGGVGLESPMAVGFLAEGSTQVETVQRVVEWLKEDQYPDWAMPMPAPRRNRKMTKDATPR
jgi:hypothetical protein